MDQPKASNEYPLIRILRQYPGPVKKKKTAFDLSALVFMVAGKNINSKLAECFCQQPLISRQPL